MKTRAALLLTSLLLISGACGEGGVGEFAEDASRIVRAQGSTREQELPASKAQVDASARRAATHAAERVGDDAAPGSGDRDMDDAVESAEATTDDAEASAESAEASAAAQGAPESTGNVVQDEAPSTASVTPVDPTVRLIDGQIAAVLTAANNALVAEANAALAELESAELRALASALVTAHTAAQARQEAIVARKRLTPKETAISSELTADADALRAKLSVDACDLERTYLELTIATHEKVLALFDAVLLPSVCDGELKSELGQARGELASALAQARSLGWLID